MMSCDIWLKGNFSSQENFITTRKERSRSLAVKLSHLVSKRPNLNLWLWELCKLFRSDYVQSFVYEDLNFEQNSLDITAVEWSIEFPSPGK